MKIPKQIKIGGRIFKIEIVLNIDHNAEGNISWRKGIIQLLTGAIMDEGAQMESFWHEIAHAFIFTNKMYFENGQLEEAFCEQFAHFVHALLTDNPDLAMEYTAGKIAEYFKKEHIK